MYKIICLPFSLMIFCDVLSQPIGTDSSLLHIYQVSIPTNPLLHNGRQYLYPYRDRKGHPFLFSDAPLTGNLQYDGACFTNVKLSYDIVADELLLYPDTSGTQILLQKERILSFDMAAHNFIRLFQNKDDKVQESDGFFELVYESANMRAVVKHQKILIDPGANSGEQPGFSQKANYFIQKDGQLFKIKNVNNLLNVLPGSLEEMKRYIHDNDLDFKKDPIGVIIKILTKYNGIK